MRRADFNSQSRAVLPRIAHELRRFGGVDYNYKKASPAFGLRRSSERATDGANRPVQAPNQHEPAIQLKAIPQKADIGTQSREQREVLGSSTNRCTI
jgi:hypothetical protein